VLMLVLVVAAFFIVAHTLVLVTRVLTGGLVFETAVPDSVVLNSSAVRSVAYSFFGSLRLHIFDRNFGIS